MIPDPDSPPQVADTPLTRFTKNSLTSSYLPAHSGKRGFSYPN